MDGRLTLKKYVQEAIPIYWMSLAWIPKGVLEKARHICFIFIWSGYIDHFSPPWEKCEHIARPKALGGRGIKIYYYSPKRWWPK
jgi:hypothetical protein